MDELLRKKILSFQENEKTEHEIYSYLAKKASAKNSKIFSSIASDEMAHYILFEKFTGMQAKPNRLKIFFYLSCAKILGITFAIKLMEKGENGAKKEYAKTLRDIPALRGVTGDEVHHEKELIRMVDEEKMNYLSSMVLAVNNAIQELAGVVVGLTFALKDTKLIGISALITGIAATLAMTASEYMAQKSRKDDLSPIKAALYTFVVYLITMILIVGPYFIFADYNHALMLSGFNIFFIVTIFSFFMSVVQEISFKKSFSEVLLVSGGVVGISFLLGSLIRMLMGTA